MVVVTEVDFVEESGAVVDVGVPVAPSDLGPWDCLKPRISQGFLSGPQ